MLRTYAIWNGNRRVLLILCVLGTVRCSVSADHARNKNTFLLGYMWGACCSPQGRRTNIPMYVLCFLRLNQ
jgi:hypothetical protein